MKRKFYLFSLLMAATATSFATENPRNVIYVNSDVTTHILMPENLKLVDISTQDIVGNQCADNMIRIKPVETDSIGETVTFFPNQFLGTITMIGERHMAQFDVKYEPDPVKANSFYNVDYDETINYSNPDVKMPQSEMIKLAWAAFDSKRKFHNIREKQYGIKAEVFNIYTIGEYFFIDFKLTNQTNIPYDIAEIRVSLSDKKQTKATNYQTVELTPLYVLNNAERFKKDYRQVLVLEKLTFPDEKVLNIEVSENQISGRVITLTIQYDDILHADALNKDKIEKELDIVKRHNAIEKQYQERETKWQIKNERLEKNNLDLRNDLIKAQIELSEAKKQLKSKGKEYQESVLNSKNKCKKNKYIYVESSECEEEVN